MKLDMTKLAKGILGRPVLSSAAKAVQQALPRVCPVATKHSDLVQHFRMNTGRSLPKRTLK
jgi:hypothetical protein